MLKKYTVLTPTYEIYGVEVKAKHAYIRRDGTLVFEGNETICGIIMAFPKNEWLRIIYDGPVKSLAQQVLEGELE